MEHSDIERRQTVGVCLLPGRERGTASEGGDTQQGRRQEPLDGMITPPPPPSTTLLRVGPGVLHHFSDASRTSVAVERAWRAV